MAFTAHLQFGDNISGSYNQEYSLASVKCLFSRDCNGVCVISDCHCKRIVAEIISPDIRDIRLYKWYSSRSPLSGRIIMDEQSVKGVYSTRIIKFENAWCHRIDEHYDINDRTRLTLTIEFTAQSVETEGITINA